MERADARRGCGAKEVALLANIGLTWYTRLEQGAAINVSPSVLGNIADALQLTEHERDHLFVLAGHRIAEATAAETAHPLAGELRLEYTSLAVPGCPDMFLIAYTTAKGSDEERKLRSLLDVDRDLAAAISN